MYICNMYVYIYIYIYVYIYIIYIAYDGKVTFVTKNDWTLTRFVQKILQGSMLWTIAFIIIMYIC